MYTAGRIPSYRYLNGMQGPAGFAALRKPLAGMIKLICLERVGLRAGAPYIP
jgi:hypothetical protein